MHFPSRAAHQMDRRDLGRAALGVTGLTILAAFLPTADVHASPPVDEDNGEGDPALDQTVSEQDEIVRGEPAVLDQGHVDLGPG